MGQLTTTGRCMQGLAHLLGITVRATVRFSLDFVVRYIRYCVAEASSAKITSAAKDEEEEYRMRLFWLYPALEAAQCFLFLLRPGEPFKQTLHGLWSHYFVGVRRGPWA